MFCPGACESGKHVSFALVRSNEHARYRRRWRDKATCQCQRNRTQIGVQEAVGKCKLIQGSKQARIQWREEKDQERDCTKESIGPRFESKLADFYRTPPIHTCPVGRSSAGNGKLFALNF